MKKKVIKYSSYIFLLLWGYAAVLKLYNWGNSRREMLLQPFPDWLANILFWFIPLLELGIVVLLLQRRTMLRGIQASVVLLGVFTIYFALAAGRAFGSVPCACGGILSGMRHEEHIIFNLAFIALGIYAWVLARKGSTSSDAKEEKAERRVAKNSE